MKPNVLTAARALAWRSARELGRWTRLRWLVATAATAVFFTGLLLSTAPVGSSENVSMGANHAVAGWVYAIVAGGAVALGMLVASYVRTPEGAAVTFCDLRWPIFGLAGIALATGSRADGSTFAGLLAGPPGSLADFARVVVGLASVLLMAWALEGRLSRERQARRLLADGEEPLECTTCRPLLPQRAAR